MQLEFWQYDDKVIADQFEKASRFAGIFPFIFNHITRIIASLFTAIAGIIALLFVSRLLAVIALVAVVPSFFVQMRLSRMQVDHWKNTISTRRLVNRIEWGIMSPAKIAEIRLFGLARHLLKVRQEMRDKDKKVRIQFERSFSLKKLIADGVEALAEVVALVWITFQIINKKQPIGQFLYVQQMISRVTSSTSQMVNIISNIDEDLANMFDYQAFMGLPSYTKSNLKLEKPPRRIALKDVTFGYPKSNNNVLDSVNIEINRGQKVAIVGENGAGKSTLIKLLTGFYQPSSGTVLIDDKDLNDINIESWHSHLSLLGQDFVQYDFATAKENIIFGAVEAKESEARVNRAVASAEASFLKKLPKGLDSYVDRWVGSEDGSDSQQLSGGQWQRLALARSLYRDAPILILDEPTSAIDALAEARIFKSLLQKNNTVIMISHRLTTIRSADVIYMMEGGKVVERGTADELISSRGSFYKMFESQL